MRQNYSLSASLLLLAVALFAGNLSYAQKPNVIIIFIDDMGYGDLSCYGNTQIQTKNIDALAARGTRFMQFYANSPVCSPSRVAMITGHYPARHQFYTYLADRKKNRENNMPDFLPASVPTLARMLKANGYATAHFGKWHLGGGRDVGDAPLPQEYGFDKSFTSFEGLGDRTLHLDDNLNKASKALGRGKITEAPQHKQTEMYVDSAIAFIRAVKQQPFFVQLFPNDVHDPYNPKEGTDKKYEQVTSNVAQQKFLATLEALDQQVGRLMTALVALDALKNTLIIFTSDNGPTDWPYYYKDNGEPPCSAGYLRGRKWSLYEGGIRVPFIVVWPGRVPAGKVNDRTVLTVADLLPSVLKLTQTPAANNYTPDGKDMSEAMLGKGSRRSGAVFWYYNNKPVPGKAENVSPMLAIRSGDWKLLMNPDGSEKQLYNLAADERESKNRVEEEKRKARALSASLLSWYQQVVEKRGQSVAQIRP